MNLRLYRWWACLAAAVLSGCALDGPQSTIVSDGPVARLQFETFLVSFWVSVVIFLVVGGVYATTLMKYRLRPEDEASLKDLPLPDQGHGSSIFEIGVILISILLVGIVAAPAVYGVFYSGTLPEGQKPLVIKVTGYQWWWKFEYPDHGVVTGNEAVIPVGTPVQFKVQTADVLHSFWVPRLGGKMDLTPGQDNWLWLQADKAGNYWGQCTEFCGDSHAFMRFRVIAKSDAEFKQWMVDQKKPVVDAAFPPQLMSKQCGICHMIRGVPGALGLVGPDLTHIGSRSTIAAGLMENTPQNLKSWIANPEYHKPGNVMAKAGYKAMNIQVTNDDAEALAQYLSKLK